MEVKLTPLGLLAGSEDIEIIGPSCILGRAPDCDVQIPLHVVSRHHCEIDVGEDEVTVHDLGSRHGTYVNGERIDDFCELSDGDVLHLAVAAIAVRVHHAPTPASGWEAPATLF